MSRSLVGSSRISRFAGWVSSRARMMRLHSPPDSAATGAHGPLGTEEEAAEVADDVARFTVHHDVVAAVRYGLGHGLVGVELTPQLIEIADLEIGAPAPRSRSSGVISPTRMRNSVLLPTPLLPMSPMRSPRMMRSQRFRISGSAP